MPTPIVAPAARAPDWIACRCGSRWTGTTTCHCAACHQTFTGLTAFEKHRRGETCRPPGLAGLVPRLRRAGYGYVTWGLPGAYRPADS